MRIERKDGSFFRLTVVGYQFPGVRDKEYDSNWLMIRIDVKHPRGSWSATDPALLTYELESLAEWLDKIKAGSRVELDQYFMEPCLELHLTSSSSRAENLVIRFSHEFRPSWARSGPPQDEEPSLEFPLAEIDLARAARSIRQQLRVFPQRTAR
jgi:hypothetical protein